MSFFSTRGGKYVSASQAILNGLSPDGGLYVPSMFPMLTAEELNKLCKLSYSERAVNIIKYYLEDYTTEELEIAIKNAYNSDKFDDGRIAPLIPIDDNTYSLELYHGPTMAFKDMALQILPRLITYAAKKNNEDREVSILVATSGDTGKAALEGFKDVENTSCTVFYPKDGVSDIQKLQMLTTGGNNTKVVGVNGNFDDTQSGLKALFVDEEFRSKMDKNNRLPSSANSINFGRLVPQIVYYISSYCDLLNMNKIAMFHSVNFVVPTGNFGNILAAYYAQSMGLPINKLICASNTNKVLTDFFNTGVYSLEREFFKTISPSMDILISSNLERLLYEMTDRNSELINKWMNDLKELGEFKINETYKTWLNAKFYAGFADDITTKQEIKKIFDKHQYLIDPHTAVGFNVLEQYRKSTNDDTPTIVASTASPYKFSENVLSAIQPGSEIHDAFDSAEVLEKLSNLRIPKQINELKQLEIRHNAVCERNEMADSILK